jgi:hypothetical protein
MNPKEIEKNVKQWRERLEQIYTRMLEIKEKEFPQPFEIEELKKLKEEGESMLKDIKTTSDILLSDMLVKRIMPIMLHNKKLAEAGNADAKKFYDHMKDGYEDMVQYIFDKFGKYQ